MIRCDNLYNEEKPKGKPTAVFVPIVESYQVCVFWYDI